MFRAYRLLGAISLLLLGSITYGADPVPLKTFMRAKLEHPKMLLEALTTEDFEAMAKQSQKIIVLTLMEQWQVLETPEYVQHSLEFRRTAGAIRDAAEAKNLDGASRAYVDLTVKCVKLS